MRHILTLSLIFGLLSPLVPTVQGADPRLPPESRAKSVRLSQIFMARPDLLARMASKKDERAFDLYFYLLRERTEQKSDQVMLNHDDCASLLGLDYKHPISYRRVIAEDLRKLERRYNLLTATNREGKDTNVLLKSIKDPVNVYRIPTNNYLRIPAAYWIYKWPQHLSLAAKVTYLMILSKESLPSSPFDWSGVIVDMAHHHHISSRFAKKGLRELRKKALVEPNYKNMRYTPNAMYDPVELEQKLEILSQRKGPERLRRARKNASVFFKGYDYKAIESLIKLERKYGRDKIKAAVKTVSRRSLHHPKRTVDTLIKTVQNLDSSQR